MYADDYDNAKKNYIHELYEKGTGHLEKEEYREAELSFKEIESKAKSDAILASNTSSILLDDISQVLKQPQRLIGIHFFNPVSRMQLVEVVHGEVSDKSILQKVDYVVNWRQDGKLYLWLRPL